jgi:hypothetical protein
MSHSTIAFDKFIQEFIPEHNIKLIEPFPLTMKDRINVICSNCNDSHQTTIQGIKIRSRFHDWCSQCSKTIQSIMATEVPRESIVKQNEKRRVNLIGKRSGRLTIVEHAGLRKIGKVQMSYWLCVCDCGEEKVVGSRQLKAGIKGRAGATLSCGCMLRDKNLNKLKSEKSKITSLKRYGSESPMQTKEVQNKNALGNNRMIIKKHWLSGEPVLCIASYEGATVDYLNHNKIDYLWQPKVFKLSSGSTYRPDLYLIKEKKWVEIKGMMRKDAQTKIDMFRLEFGELEVWDGKYLRSLGLKIRNGKMVYE